MNGHTEEPDRPPVIPGEQEPWPVTVPEPTPVPSPQRPEHPDVPEPWPVPLPEHTPPPEVDTAETVVEDT